MGLFDFRQQKPLHRMGLENIETNSDRTPMYFCKNCQEYVPTHKTLWVDALNPHLLLGRKGYSFYCKCGQEIFFWHCAIKHTDT